MQNRSRLDLFRFDRNRNNYDLHGTPFPEQTVEFSLSMHQYRKTGRHEYIFSPTILCVEGI